jgi:hypothetical protein
MKTLALAAAMFATSLPAATLQEYGWSWPLGGSCESGACQIELTPEVYAASVDPGLRDIEVFNAAAEAVPLAVVAFDQRVVLHDEQVGLPTFALPQAAVGVDDSLHVHLQRGGAGRLRSLDADSSTAASPTPTDYVLDASVVQGDIDSLWLEWRSDSGDINAQFAVDASDDLQHWQSVVATATVLDLHQRGTLLAHRNIPLPGTHANYLRLHRLDHGAALAELVVQARLRLRESATVPARRWLTAAFVEGHANPATDSSSGLAPAATYLYRLPAALAVEAARIELGSDNSLARLSLASQHRADAPHRPVDEVAQWSLRGEVMAFRLRQDDLRIANDEFALPPDGRAEYWRIQAWQPLDRAPTLTLAWRPERLVFLAHGAGPYRLAAGSRTARRADYPIDAALAQFRTRLGAQWQPALIGLGERATLAGPAAIQAQPPARPWKTWILWVVLIAGAALVAGLAVHLLRQAKRPT